MTGWGPRKPKIKHSRSTSTSRKHLNIIPKYPSYLQISKTKEHVKVRWRRTLIPLTLLRNHPASSSSQQILHSPNKRNAVLLSNILLSRQYSLISLPLASQTNPISQTQISKQTKQFNKHVSLRNRSCRLQETHLQTQQRWSARALRYLPLPYFIRLRGISDRFVGLYKVATGEDITKAEKPGMFDLKVRSPQPQTFWEVILAMIMMLILLGNRARQRIKHGNPRSTRVLRPMRRRRNTSRWWSRWRRSLGMMRIRFLRL